MSEEKKDLKARSKEIYETIKQTPYYYVPVGLMNVLGFKEKEFTRKPLIGIANSWSEINPGHKHLLWLGEAVKEGIIEAGGIPMQFNVVSPCDGFANGNVGMNYILPQREIVADSIEAMVEAHRLDALVTLSSCDKINPGVMMATARLDIPTICVPGGPGMYEVELAPETIYKGIENRYYEELEWKKKCVNNVCYGACPLMGTANTTQCLMEAFGLTLPNAATMPATSQIKYRMAKESGMRIIQMLKDDVRPSAIMTKKSLENVLMVDMAIGGSTNSAIHIPAIAHEMGIDFDLAQFNEIAKKIPMIANISPSGHYSINDLYKAGGIPAVMSRIREHLNLDCSTASGKTWKRLLKKVQVLDDNIIRPLNNPIHPEGGTVVLYGNLAPEGAVVKQSGLVHEHMKAFKGPARIFESEKVAIDAVAAKEVKNGSVVIVRNQGPKGAPGMPELLALTTLLIFLKDMDNIALITDARFSGASVGPVIGHVCPEAYIGGPLAIIKDGDIIEIDIQKRLLRADLGDEEIQQRLKGWKPPSKPLKRGILRKYRQLVTSAAKGCIMKD
ncbi:MAG: dihydroxy-acid dehydratase [Candidatus Hodarchaeota archaeon]